MRLCAPLVVAALAIASPQAAQASLINLKLGGEHLVEVKVGESAGTTSGGSSGSGSSGSLLEVGVLGKSPSGGTQVANVGLGEQHIEVNLPPAPVVQTPSVPAVGETPTSTAGGREETRGSGGLAESPAAGGSSTAFSTERATTTATPSTAPVSEERDETKPSTGASAPTHRLHAHRPAGAGGSGVTASTLAAALTRATPTAQKTVTPRHAKATRGSSDPLSSLGRSLPLPLPVPDWSKPIILALLALAIALGVRSQRAARRARRLERSGLALMRDLDVLQGALVPPIEGEVGGLALSVAYRPADGPAAGGDFYDVFKPSPETVAVILGDVVGHGHDALQRAALARYTVRAYLQGTHEPRQALSLAGRALASEDCAQLATVAVALFDSRHGTLTYALAGHPPPLMVGVCCPDSAAVCSSPPLGWSVPTGRRQRTITLPEGARVCLFSDGLIEARCGEDASELLGRERLHELLAALPHGVDADELLAAVRSQARATPDDMAAVILTPIEGAHGAHTDLEELEFDRRAIDNGQLRAFLDGCGVFEPTIDMLLHDAEDTLAAAEDTAIVLVDRSRDRVGASLVSPPRRNSLFAGRRRGDAPVVAGLSA
jgi:hypothetical protein